MRSHRLLVWLRRAPRTASLPHRSPRRLLLPLLGAWVLLAAALAPQALQAAQPVFTTPEQRPVPLRSQPWPSGSFLVLAYHDVDDDEADQRYLAVTTRKLVGEFAWLRENGYQPVSVQQILDAHAGRSPLPEKAVLLSFDDGFSSFYTRVFPLLRAYQWPALWAPVGSWLDALPDQPIDFGGLVTPRERFATWEQVREVHRSGLVEIGAHTQNLHFGHIANPQGNTQPAAASLFYDQQDGRYESHAQFEARISQDVQAITGRIARHTGQPPRAWVWPYGAMHGRSWQIARQHGYQLSFSLEPGLANAADLDNIPRFLISADLRLSQFADFITGIQDAEPLRAAHVDLDYVYDSDPEQQERNIDALVQRIHDMRLNTVFLQAFADPQGDGLVRAVYFPNRVLPMRADLFNRVAWQLRTRSQARVYAWMPVLAFDLEPGLARVGHAAAVEPFDGGSHEAAPSIPAPPAPGQYSRLSPFDPAARQAIRTLYEDLGWQAAFSGVLFHDDAMLTEDEDLSAPALQAYRDAGFTGALPVPLEDAEQQQRWMRFKTGALTDFTLELVDAVRGVRGAHVRSARNVFAGTITEPGSERWLAQNFRQALAAYDWTVPMVMPLMEQVPRRQIDAWLDGIVDAVARIPGALDKTVFEVQAVDWLQPDQEGRQRRIPSAEIAHWLRRLNLRGARHLAYYPDDFKHQHPDAASMRRHLSNHWFPLP
ncbi:poly-beta-1,6-N-acetyl-D-glucosamine N-deacetylase PgaB [Corticibacter populi]|uniref:Poly-beta-1,6-N-acetyl-D-glucosamine N-deacetylase PgaB n=1 Tax=Corticibacter populi TaxID=1550736 RepID=A0A3M6R165_9BURK|nr:poly-beta-1,6-N-acetyl-D-glucosamine N-deacetylase PgaB [Corticibacter populi]